MSRAGVIARRGVVWRGEDAVAISRTKRQELANGRCFHCHRERLPQPADAGFAMTVQKGKDFSDGWVLPLPA